MHPQRTATVETVRVAATNMDIGTVTASIDGLLATLSGVTDVASAQAALPKLQNVMAQIDKGGEWIEQLSAEQRKAIADVVKPAVPMIKEWVDKALAVPGVAEALKPTLDDLKTKFAKLVA